MAYLRSIERECSYRGCTSAAKVELLNLRNSEMGSYCKRHGTQALRDQLGREEAAARSEREAPSGRPGA